MIANVTATRVAAGVLGLVLFANLALAKHFQFHERTGETVAQCARTFRFDPDAPSSQDSWLREYALPALDRAQIERSSKFEFKATTSIKDFRVVYCTGNDDNSHRAKYYVLINPNTAKKYRDGKISDLNFFYQVFFHIAPALAPHTFKSSTEEDIYAYHFAGKHAALMFPKISANTIIAAAKIELWQADDLTAELRQGAVFGGVMNARKGQVAAGVFSGLKLPGYYVEGRDQFGGAVVVESADMCHARLMQEPKALMYEWRADTKHCGLFAHTTYRKEEDPNSKNTVGMRLGRKILGTGF